MAERWTFIVLVAVMSWAAARQFVTLRNAAR
jgi:hypothetical protein